MPTLVRTLYRFGYRVLDAANAQEALSRVVDGPDVRPLITDILVPGDNGRHLAAKLCTAYPAVKVLYVSGTSTRPIIEDTMACPDVHFLPKPFGSVRLMEKVREMLGPP